jgi:ELWxxDGT repeat protein
MLDWCLAAWRNFSLPHPFVSPERSSIGVVFAAEVPMPRHIKPSAVRFPARVTAMHLCLAALLVLALVPGTRADGGPVFLVKNINTIPEQYPLFDIGSLIAVGDQVYFTAQERRHGRELWKSDGTTVGTALVKDIAPGEAFSNVPAEWTNVNGTLFFVADDGFRGFELWKSDGTANGTVRVKDINPGINGSSPADLVDINETLLFTAADASYGRELWRSDGTAAGTVRVKDINVGAGYAFPVDNLRPNLTNVAGTLFFLAHDGHSGYELWRSDGTANGTVRVKDINPGAGGVFQPIDGTLLIDVNGILFFWRR